MFQRHHVPAEGYEDRFDPGPQPLMDHAIKRLPVIIDDPPAIPKPVFPAFLQALEDVAFVEFGVADQRDHAPR